jgi:pimeloyl-ACP methyl ester carboxylesterase
LVATPLRHELVDQPWGRQHVVHAGHEDRPAVVLVHGWPQHWLAWRHVIPALARHHHVVAVDLRGMGWSRDEADAPPTHAELAADVLAACRQLALRTPALVGHDWGGWLAFLAALDRPDLLSQVIGVSIAPPWLDRRALLRHAPVLAYTLPMAVAGGLVAGRPGLVAGMLQRSCHTPAWQRGHDVEALRSYQERIALPSARRTTQALYGELVCTQARRRSGHRTDRLGIPGAIVLGAHEPITTPDLFWRRTAPGELSVRTVTGAGHWLPEERPEGLVVELRRLLASAQGDAQPTGERPVAHT